jgi:hypothetical protein
VLAGTMRMEIILARHGRPKLSQNGWVAPCQIAGWIIESRNGHRVVEHDGRWQAFSRQISRYVDDGLTVAVPANQGDCDAHLIADEVAVIYLAKGTRK